MANEKNLMPIEEVNSRRTREEPSKDSRKGGISNGGFRRCAQNPNQMAKTLANLPATGEFEEMLDELGIEPDERNGKMVLVAAMFVKAANGSVGAFDRFLDLLGESVAREELALKKQEAKRRNTPSNGKLEELISALQEEQDDLHTEAADADEPVETE